MRPRRRDSPDEDLCESLSIHPREEVVRKAKRVPRTGKTMLEDDHFDLPESPVKRRDPAVIVILAVVFVLSLKPDILPILAKALELLRV